MNFQKDYNLYFVFMRVCEQKNYSAVAKMLGYSSPESIREKMETLASQVGVEKLFHGHSRGVTPTNEALELYQGVKSHFENIDLVEKNIKEFSPTSEAVIKITMSSTILNFLLADYFKEFSKKYPLVRFRVFTRVQQEQLQLHAKFKMVDLVIDMDYNNKANGLETTDLFDLDYIFIASKQFLKAHNLSQNLTTKDLERLPIIGDPEVESFAKATGINAKPYFITAVTDSIYPLVKKQMGVGVYYDKLFNAQKQENANCDVVKLNVNGATAQKLKFSCGHNSGYLTKAAQVLIAGLTQFANKL